MFWFRKNVLLCAALTLAAIAVGVAPSHAAKPGGGAGYTLVRLAPVGVAIASSVPYDVDDAGNVVGYYQPASGQRRAFYFDRAGNTLYTLAGGTNATGLNSLGQIVGLNDTQAICWSSRLAAPTALNGLTGQTFGAARAINSGGLIVGQSVVGGASHAVVWTVGTTSVAAELPPLPGETHADVLGISEFDQVGIATAVGYCSTTDIHGDEDGRATMWGLSFVGGNLIVAGPIDLGSLKGGPARADGVNLAGEGGKGDKSNLCRGKDTTCSKVHAKLDLSPLVRGRVRSALRHVPLSGPLGGTRPCPVLGPSDQPSPHRVVHQDCSEVELQAVTTKSGRLVRCE